MPRRSIVLALLAIAVSAAAAVPADARRAASVCAGSCYAAPVGSGALLLFSGHGYGHGVGMSQYGAYGYALHGAGYREILAHYYPGTTLGTVASGSIRILLADRRKRLDLSSEAPVTVTDGNGETYALAAGSLTLDPSLEVPVEGRAKPAALAPPLTFAPAAGATITLEHPYHGRILVDVVGGKLRVIDVLPLEQYLRGVVAAEMPSDWPAPALQAQAVAARSYALATRRVGAPFDVFGDTRSQLYLGAGHEQPAASAAVDATKGEVLLYAGKVATTYFSSTSGGQTESSVDWDGTDVPYLVSVPDPYDDLSPYHDWGPVPMTARSAAKALHVSGPITDVTTTPDTAGRVATVDLSTAAALVSMPATKARVALGLRSTWFDVGVLSLVPPAPAAPVAYGSAVTLTGTIRDVQSVTLEQRATGGSWQPVAPVAAGSGATFSLTVHPTITTDYRLATATAAAGGVRIRVKPVVQISTLDATGVTGKETPALGGASISLQRQAVNGSWTAVTTGSAAADGTFSLPAAAGAGTYRVVVAAGPGYAVGASAPQTAST